MNEVYIFIAVFLPSTVNIIDESGSEASKDYGSFRYRTGSGSIYKKLIFRFDAPKPTDPPDKETDPDP
jgi:hypothetical protein